MSKFPMVDNLGMKIETCTNAFGSRDFVVNAYKLESILQSAQVVYGTNQYRPDEYEWSKNKLDSDTHCALLLVITPIKKKTKAEAALEFMQRFIEQKTVWHSQSAWEEAKRILEMKDEE